MSPTPDKSIENKPVKRKSQAKKLSILAHKEEVTRYAEAGCTIEQIGKILGVCERTVKNWLQDPEFRRHYDMGRQKALFNLQKTAFQLAQEGDTTMIIFLLKTQCGWRERDREPSEQQNAIHQQISIYLPQKQDEKNITTINYDSSQQ